LFSNRVLGIRYVAPFLRPYPLLRQLHHGG
jgi:hypothetical protein